MAITTSRIPSKLTSSYNLFHVRFFSSLASSPLHLTTPLNDPATSPEQPPSDVINLNNTEKLFSSVKTGALVTSLINLYAMAVDPLVEFGTAVMQSPVVMKTRLSRAAVFGAVRATIYRHFCAGETPEEASETVRRMWKQVGLRSILDYAVEDAEDVDAARRNMDGFLRTLDMVAALSPPSEN